MTRALQDTALSFRSRAAAVTSLQCSFGTVPALQKNHQLWEIQA
jgi:hypothetical protein